MPEDKDKQYSFPDDYNEFNLDGEEDSKIEFPDGKLEDEKTIESKILALGQHKTQVAQWPNWAEWMRKRAEAAGAPQGIKYAEAFKRLVLS